MGTPYPFHLRDYFFELSNFEVIGLDGPQAEEGADPKPLHSLQFQIGHPDEGGQVDEGVEKIVYRLIVLLNRVRELPPEVCYRGEFRIAGVFERPTRDSIDPPPSMEEYHTLAVAGVISTLFGVIREHVASLTAPTPFPKLVLPSISPAAIAEGMTKPGEDEEE